MRTLAAHLLALGVAVVAVRATAQSVTGFPPPAPSPGTEVNGTVRLPNGSLAGLNRSVLERFAALIVEEAEALSSANVRAVGRNVGVQLSQRRGDGAVQTFDTFFTNDQGQFLTVSAQRHQRRHLSVRALGREWAIADTSVRLQHHGAYGC